MEYFQYFLLKGSPFKPASPKNAVYFSPTHLEGLTTLESGLLGELTGLTMLTGEAGTGKTTLIYAMLQRDYKRVRIARVDDPKLSFLEMMQVVMPQLNLYSSGTTKLDYLKTLDHLLDLHGKEERIAIIVDEAQVVSDEVLDELRLLSNRGQRDDRRLQLILVGQPELAERLKQPKLRQLNQRISTRGMLRPLNPREALMYVECLLSAQGGKSSAIFEPHALERLLRLSDGIPRKINMLCHAAMMAAFYTGDRKITVRTAKKIAAEYQASIGQAKGFSLGGLATVMGAAVAAILLLGFVYRNGWWGQARARATFLSDIIGKRIQQADLKATSPKALAVYPEAKPAASISAREREAGMVNAPALTTPPAPNAVMTHAAAEQTPISRQTGSTGGSTQAQANSAAQAQTRSQVTVREGDTLEKIAARYLGSDAEVNNLIQANPQIADVNDLSVGQTIYLPSGIAPKDSSK
jgi:general secretion pathway protein A